MALFKISKGSKSNLPATLTEGYCWYTFEDSKFYIDHKDENGNLVRKALNAQNCETLMGVSLEELKNEIITQDAVVLHEAQNYTDAAIEELNAKIGEGIDTSNLATVDKVKSIDTWSEGVSELTTDDGISWREGFAFNTAGNLEGDNIAYGDIHHRIPIVAGNGIEFENDGNVVKINATGGSSSSVSLIGTWTIIDEPEIPQEDLPLSFTSNGTEYMAIGYTSMGSSTWGINALSYQRRDEGYYNAAYTNNPSGNYGITHGWSNEAYKTITVTEEPTDANAIAWLGANTDAPKITPTVSLPPCDSTNNGQFLMCVSGVPTWTSVPNAEEVGF